MCRVESFAGRLAMGEEAPSPVICTGEGPTRRFSNWVSIRLSKLVEFAIVPAFSGKDWRWAKLKPGSELTISF